MVLDTKLFEAIFNQETGGQGVVTPQELYDLGAIYSLQVKGKLKSDFSELPDFLHQFRIQSLDKAKATILLQIYLISISNSMRPSREKQVNIKDFCFELTNQLNKALANILKENRDQEADAQFQDVESRKVEQDLYTENINLRDNIYSKGLEKIKLSAIKEELVLKQASLTKNYNELLFENKKASKDNSIIKDKIEICTEKFTGFQAKSKELRGLLAQLELTTGELQGKLIASKLEHSSLLQVVRGQKNLSTKLDCLNMDIEALKHDNSSLDMEIQELRGLKMAAKTNSNSFIGSSPQFNLKTELENSTPELLKLTLDTPAHTHRKKSSVAGAPRKKRQPLPKRFVDKPDLTVAIINLEAEIAEMEKQHMEASFKLQEVRDGKRLRNQRKCISNQRHAAIQTDISLTSIEATRRILTSPLRIQNLQPDYVYLVSYYFIRWGLLFCSALFIAVLLQTSPLNSIQQARR